MINFLLRARAHRRRQPRGQDLAGEREREMHQQSSQVEKPLGLFAAQHTNNSFSKREREKKNITSVSNAISPHSAISGRVVEFDSTARMDGGIWQSNALARSAEQDDAHGEHLDRPALLAYLLVRCRGWHDLSQVTPPAAGSPTPSRGSSLSGEPQRGVSSLRPVRLIIKKR